MEVQMQGGNTSNWAQNYVDGTPTISAATSKREGPAKQMEQSSVQTQTPNEEGKHCDRNPGEEGSCALALDLERPPPRIASTPSPTLLGRTGSGRGDAPTTDNTTRKDPEKNV